MLAKTRSSYLTGFNCLVRYCEANGLTLAKVATSRAALCDFFAYMAYDFDANTESGRLAPKAFGNYVTGAFFHLRARGVLYTDPLASPQVRMVKEGAMRVLRTPAATRRGFTPRELRNEVRALRQLGTYDAELAAAALVLAFFFLLRASSITRTAGTDFGLRLRDVVLDTDARTVTVSARVKRTGRCHGRHKTLVNRLQATGEKELCPFKAARRLRMARRRERRRLGITTPPDPDAPLFPVSEEHPEQSRGYRWITRLCRDAVARANECSDTPDIPAGHLTPHSLRIGGTTAGAAAGIPLPVLMRLGGWSSDAILLYVRATADPLDGVAQAMAKAYCELLGP